MRPSCVALLLAVPVLAALAPVTNAATFGHSPLAPGASSSPKAPRSATITLTQSASNSIVSGGSVACNNGAATTENHFLRRFVLDTDHGILTPFDISAVEFGIEAAFTASGSQPITVNLYRLPKALPFVFANLVLLATSTANVPDQSLSIATFPISTTLVDPTTNDLVVEVHSYDGTGTGAVFFIGANSAGQIRPSYLASADCGVPEPTTTAGIGFPSMMIYMGVLGETPTAIKALSWGKVKSTYR